MTGVDFCGTNQEGLGTQKAELKIVGCDLHPKQPGFITVKLSAS
jgi:hypothetical protein